jgi:hypothetical protein
MQVLAPIRRDARVEDVVMAALDDIDRIDLKIAEMGYGGRRRLRPGAEGLGRVKALSPQPDSTRLRRGELNG